MRKPQTLHELKQRILKPQPKFANKGDEAFRTSSFGKAVTAWDGQYKHYKRPLEVKSKNIPEKKFEDGSVTKYPKTKDYNLVPRGHKKKMKPQIV